MILSIKNGRYAFLIGLDLMSFWKEFQQHLKDLFKRPRATTFKRPIYQTFNKTNII